MYNKPQFLMEDKSMDENNLLDKFEDILDVGPIPLILSIIVCILFNAIAIVCPTVLKIAVIICGYVFLAYGIIKTFGNYE